MLLKRRCADLRIAEKIFKCSETQYEKKMVQAQFNNRYIFLGQLKMRRRFQKGILNNMALQKSLPSINNLCLKT